MNKIELLAPANSLVKVKIAFMAGADAIYVGGEYSLRSRAGSLTIDEIKEMADYIHANNKKLFVTVNMVFHNNDLEGIKEYLINLDKIHVDAVIVSSLSILVLTKKHTNMEVHMSTQLSTLNSGAISYFKKYGADRVVLARECSMDEIKEIAASSDLPLEVFIHGGMCSNYSGKCALSNRMANRDSNRGGCAHSCRWYYDLYNRGDKITNRNKKFSLSSKDLRATSYIADLINAGVASLKIEGRMKSENYIRQTVKTYRDMIDEIYSKGGVLSQERIDYYNSQLDFAENRVTDDGFFSGDSNNSKIIYGVNGAGVRHDYVAMVMDYNDKSNYAIIEVKNKFELGDKLEVVSPSKDYPEFVNSGMFDPDWKFVEVANKPASILYIRLPYSVKKYDMIRKISK